MVVTCRGSDADGVQAAAAGHADAMAYLGDMYANGMGVKQASKVECWWDQC
jgi:TPR repeat protein